jgi:hypothetical protein
MGLRNALHKAAGLFVEMPDTPTQFTPTVDPLPDPPAPTPTRTVADVVKAAPGPNLDQIQVPPDTAKSPPVGPDGAPDFKTIFERSGVPAVSFGAEEALQVIGSLPAELPMDVKRKTVGATLSAMGKAMGVTTDSVVSDASRKIAALASFTDQLTAQTHQYQVLVEQRTADLKAQIASCEADLAKAQEKLANFVQACEEEGHRLDDVLEFFTLDKPPSKNA